jgi:hypothetical protein
MGSASARPSSLATDARCVTASADCFVDMCERGGENLQAHRLLAGADGIPNEDLPPVRGHTFHGFRHLYASLALTPQYAALSDRLNHQTVNATRQTRELMGDGR